MTKEKSMAVNIVNGHPTPAVKCMVCQVPKLIPVPMDGEDLIAMIEDFLEEHSPCINREALIMVDDE